MRRFRHAPVEIPPEGEKRNGVSAWGRDVSAYGRVGGSACGRNETAGRRIGVGESETAGRRIGTRGTVGLRSRATGVARS